MPKTYQIIHKSDPIYLKAKYGAHVYLKDNERLVEVTDQNKLLEKAIELLRNIGKTLETTYTIFPFEGEVNKFLDSLPSDYQQKDISLKLFGL